MDKPLVSVICLCYNHGSYVEQAIKSVMEQSYTNTELIVIDDASTDHSQSVINKMRETYGFQAHFNVDNLGNCNSFNIGFKRSSGKYIIDLAADDLLLADRIMEGVRSLESKGEKYAVNFCDVELIDEDGQPKGTHFNRNEEGKLTETVPEGDIYKILLERYFLSTPSMMMSRKVLDELGGYDENLSYEDFDFWIRSARNYHYAFTNRVLVKKHVLKTSLSSSQYQHKNKHLLSTAKVCEKALALNRNKEEDNALSKRINYEMRWALITENWEASLNFLDLKRALAGSHWSYLFLEWIIKVKPPWYRFWRWLM